MQDFPQYLKTLGALWISVVAGSTLPTIIDIGLGLVWPRWKQWADTHHLNEQRRHIVKVAFIVFALVAAGYVAWDKEHKALLILQKEITANSQANNPASNQAAPLRPASAQREHLERALETWSANIAPDGKAISGDHAGSASDIRSWTLKTAQIPMINHGSDLLRWQVKSVEVYQDGRRVASGKAQNPQLLPATTRAVASVDLTPEVPFTPATTALTFKYLVGYDTVPSTGERQTGKTMKITVLWHPPDPLNFAVPNPELQPTIVEEIER